VVADFDPRQLDALEDALEDLEIDGDLAGLELAPELLERLAEYQQVLALTRDVFPLDDPPEGLLDDVLAEAREVARNAPVPTPELRGDWRRTWERWRNSLVPFTALAGAAALVLWIAQPDDDHQLARVDGEIAKSDEAPSKTSPGEPASGQAREQDSAEAAGSAAEAVEQVEPIELEDDTIGTDPSPQPTKLASKRKPASTNTAGAASTPAVAPDPIDSVTPLSKDDAWTDLERADAARRKGDCDRARKLYEKVIAASSQSTALAQAKAGIGLCFEQDGKSSTAATWFDDARQNSPGIDAWIRGQRDDQPLPGEKKKQSPSKTNDAFGDLD
jgi:tetratricopeptide (TPR) repeat protein